MRSNKKSKIAYWSLRARSVSFAVKIAALILCLSTSALLYNFFFTHFPGNNYFPQHSTAFFCLLVLIYWGMLLQFGRANRYTKQVKELQYFFLMMSCISLASNAVQYTPYPLIDTHIIAWEQKILPVTLEKLMAWAYAQPNLLKILRLSYNALPYFMLFTPLGLIAFNHIQRVREYYCLMLVSTLIGFSCYYFFPTAGPASCIASDYFTLMQKATFLKFNQIHQSIPPTTIEGGMIALPSFHVIWAWLCLFLLRSWPIIFILIAPIMLSLMFACVLLGWHYPSDILASLVVIGVSHWMTRHFFYDDKAMASSSLAT